MDGGGIYTHRSNSNSNSHTLRKRRRNGSRKYATASEVNNHIIVFEKIPGGKSKKKKSDKMVEQMVQLEWNSRKER